MKFSLKTKLSFTISMVVLLTVAIISLLANVFINQHFKDYITREQQERTQEIVSDLGRQYNKLTNTWNLDFLHTIGMDALYDGYIIQIYDSQNHVLWDAQTCDMSACMQVTNDISERMQEKYPSIEGEFIVKNFNLIQNGQIVGTAHISYYGPYFLSENDFDFLDSLNKILLGIGFFSFITSIAIGWLISKRISNPILITAHVAKNMSDGDYALRIEEKTDTKELEELMNSINHLADSLGKQEILRKQLTADVAHELRTPLTTVGTSMEAMIEGVWEPTPERLQSCHDEINRISKIVCDLENLAKIENETIMIHKTKVDLLEIIKKSLSTFEMEIQKKNLNIAVSGNSIEYFADRERMSQVLINLLSNSVKYTPDGGKIHIELSQIPEEVTIRIKDNGIGIPQEELSFIFERFYRADKSRNRASGGSGIGLAIVKSIVTAHGGKIKVESRLHEGSCFEVILPKDQN